MLHFLLFRQLLRNFSNPFSGPRSNQKISVEPPVCRVIRQCICFYMLYVWEVLSRLAPKAFESREVQVLCSYWRTDFSELYWELLKGRDNITDFQSCQICFLITILLKPLAHGPRILKAGQGLFRQFLKSFQQIQTACGAKQLRT